MRILSLIAFLAFSSAFATTQTRFQSLNEYFNHGTLPDQGEMLGAWSGRCYLVEEPNKATPAVLASATSKVYDQVNEGNHGPLFPPAPARLMFSTLILIPNYSQPADFYDNPSAETLKGIKSFMTKKVLKDNEAQAVDGAYVTVNAADKSMIIIRKYQNYFIARAMTLPDAENRKGSEVVAACYFFKKVME